MIPGAAGLLMAVLLDSAGNQSPGRVPEIPEVRVIASAASKDSSGSYSLPEVLVERKRWTRDAAGLPVASTVITRAAIEASGAVNLGEILRPIVGVRVASLGGVGAFTPVSIRGSSNDQVLVLIDGRRLNAAQGGGADLSDVPLENIERIEVLRGGASAVYGPDAIGGVVHLITRDGGSGRSARLSAGLGSFGTRLVSGELEAGGPDVRGRLSGRVLLSEGDYDVAGAAGAGDTRRANGELESGFADGALTLRPRFAAGADVRAGHYRATRGVPGATQFPSPSATQRDERSALDVEFRGLHPGPAAGILSGTRTVTNLSVFAQRQIRWYEDPVHALGAVDDAHRNDAAGVEFRQIRDFGAAGLLTAAVEYRLDNLESTTDGRHKRSARSIVLRNKFSFSYLGAIVTPALRYDDIDDFTPQWSPKLMARLSPTGRFEITASLGRSFRPPSFSDLFLPARASAAGNPDLKPERALDADLAAAWSSARIRVGAGVFVNRIHDLIQWTPGAAGVWRPHNVDGARLRGIEMETDVAFAVPGWARSAHAHLNYTILDPEDAGHEPNTGGRDLVYRPRHRANAQLRVPVGDWSVETQARYTGSVFTTRANTKSLPGYATLDVIGRWEVSPVTTLEVQGLNLTGATYQDIRDYPVPGRQWRVSMKVAVGEDS